MGAFGGVHHHGDVVVFQAIDDVRAALVDFVDQRRLDAFGLQPIGGAFGGDDLEAKRYQTARGGGKGAGFVHIFDRDKDAASFGQDHACAHLCLEEGQSKGAIPAHDFAGRAHFWPQNRINARKARKGQHGFFDREPRGDRVGEGEGIGQGQGGVGADACRIGRAQREVRHRLACHQAGGNGGNRAVGGFGDERHGARGARVDFQHKDHAVFDRELHVHQANHIQRAGHGDGLHL